MKALAVCLSLLFFAAAPAAAGLPSADRVDNLIGHWSCESAQSSTGTMDFVRQNDSTITMRHPFKTAFGQRGEFDEIYTLDSSTQRWTWMGRKTHSPELRQQGSAGAWTGDTWTIEGSMRIALLGTMDPGIYQQRNAKTPLRVVYTRFDDDAFRRDIEIPQNGRWLKQSTDTCRRTANE